MSCGCLLTPCVLQENRRLEVELLDSAEKLMEAQSQVSKLQASVDNIMKERVRRSLPASRFPSRWVAVFSDFFVPSRVSLQFGDLDPASADFFLQEERIKQLRAGYEAQYRVMKKIEQPRR